MKILNFSGFVVCDLKADIYRQHVELMKLCNKIYINGPGHMTKMDAMPIYGKIFKNRID